MCGFCIFLKWSTELLLKFAELSLSTEIKKIPSQNSMNIFLCCTEAKFPVLQVYTLSDVHRTFQLSHPVNVQQGVSGTISEFIAERGVFRR